MLQGNPLPSNLAVTSERNLAFVVSTLGVGVSLAEQNGIGGRD